MNNLVFNTSENPLHCSTTVVDPVVSSSLQTDYTSAGLLYVVSSATVALLASGFLVMQISNPSGSGKNINIAQMSFGTSGNTTVDIFKNATFAVAGTSVTPQNRNTAFSNSSVMTAKYTTSASDPTTGGSLWTSTSLTDGSFYVNYDGTFVVAPNNTFYVRLTNLTLVVNRMSVNVTWWEK